MKAKVWDDGVRGIESYRSEYAVKDRFSALGRQPQGGRDRLVHDRVRDAVHEAQRRLGRQQRLLDAAQPRRR